MGEGGHPCTYQRRNVIIRIVRPLGFLLLILGACQGAPEPAPSGKPLRDFRGIIHCHSKYSHDSKGTYEEILAAAKAAKVDFICITDHPPKEDAELSLREGWSGLREGVLFIQGHEVAGKNLLALGIRSHVGGETPKDRIAAIHAQGGVAIVSHPEEVKDWSLYEHADGMEIYNVHAAFTRKSKDKTFPVQMMKKLKEDPDRSFQLLQELDPAILKKWDELNQKRRFVGIAGNDSHQNVNFFGLQLDPYPRAFKFVTTHVLAEELTQEAILEGLRKGRAYVKFELSSRKDLDPEGLYWMGRERSSREFTSRPLSRIVQVQEGLFESGSSARWIKDGQVYEMPFLPGAEPPPGYRYYGVAGAGVYRAELWTVATNPGVSEPWVVTNPLIVR